jgi:putative nucleotidyltransferase with HDIG domain
VSEKAVEIIHNFMTAASSCSLYNREHSAVKEFSAKSIENMEEFFASDQGVNFTVLGTSLLFNEGRVSSRNPTVHTFVKKLRRKGVEKIVLRKDVTTDELVDFISDLMSQKETPKSSMNIAVGIVEVKYKGGGLDVSGIIDQNVEKVKGVQKEAAETRKLDMVMLEDIALSLITTIKDEANILKVLSPVKAYSDYTFVHTTNVSILSLYLAESLGLEGDMLHEVGIAGLLHDIGKLFIPLEILHKEGKLDDEEFDVIKSHSLMGAMYLSELQDPPKLAIIAAFEHHMRYDGKGYPVTKRRGHNQHIISQIISIADFFDAVRADRPYRKGMEIPKIVGIIKESSGTIFNPALTDHFLDTLHQAGAI